MIWATTRRLDWALRTRGSDLSAWPAEERAAALSLMRRCPTARHLVADRMADESEGGDELERCRPLLDRMQGRLRRRMVFRAPARPAMRLGMLAACAAAGLYIGVANGELDLTDPFASVPAVALDAR